MSKLEIFLGICTLLSGIGGYSISNIRASKKLDRMKVNELYEKVRNKKEVFEDSLADMRCLEKDCSLKIRERTFLKVYQKYTSLYNEVDSFCNQLLNKVINNTSYVKENFLPTLSELAIIQAETFKFLNDYASQYEFDQLNKPDYKAFDNYDKFLIKYNGGDGSHFWRNLKNKRRDSGFE